MYYGNHIKTLTENLEIINRNIDSLRETVKYAPKPISNITNRDTENRCVSPFPSQFISSIIPPAVGKGANAARMLKDIKPIAAHYYR